LARRSAVIADFGPPTAAEPQSTALPARQTFELPDQRLQCPCFLAILVCIDVAAGQSARLGPLLQAAIAGARRLAHPPSLALSLGIGTILLWLRRDEAVLGERLDELAAVAAEHSFSLYSASGAILRGWVKVKNGDVAEGMSLLRSGSIAYRAIGQEAWMPFFIALLAAACEIAGQVEEGLTLLDDALEIVERTGERWFAAELNRHKGQLLLRQRHSEAAELLYRKALSIAEGQGAKLWELRAAVSLARLRRDQGRHAEARDLLAPIYGWFTEGLDTADLKEAKALLDELI
jgi:predicted ATPase